MGYCNQSRGLNRSSVRSSYTFNLSYIMPSCPDATHRRCGDGRRLLFDLGFGKRAGTPTDVYLLNSSFAMQVDTGSSFQGSVPLFMHLYARSCSPGHSPAEVFDTIHAWEAARLKEIQKKALSQLPAQLQERIHWHNVPVVMDGGGEGDFFKQLEASARPQDFVAVKVDIDGGPETQIVRRIADSPKFARLVDELYFECHNPYDGMSFGWGHRRFANSIDDCLKLMQRLRFNGICSHFWI